MYIIVVHARSNTHIWTVLLIQSVVVVVVVVEVVVVVVVLVVVGTTDWKPAATTTTNTNTTAAATEATDILGAWRAAARAASFRTPACGYALAAASCAAPLLALPATEREERDGGMEGECMGLMCVCVYEMQYSYSIHTTCVMGWIGYVKIETKGRLKMVIHSL